MTISGVNDYKRIESIANDYKRTMTVGGHS